MTAAARCWRTCWTRRRRRRRRSCWRRSAAPRAAACRCGRRHLHRRRRRSPRNPTNRRRSWSRGYRRFTRPAAAPMSASCRCIWSAPPRRRRTSHLASPRKSPLRWPGSAGCSWSPPIRSLRFASETRDETAIRRTFGIDFLVDGSIQRVRNRLRITVRLMDLRAGNQVVWARRFDRQYERPAVAAGRDRLGGGGADRSGDPADRGQAQCRPHAGRCHRL